MTLTDFRTLIRAYVPGAKSSVVTNTLLELILNKAVDDVNSKAKALIAEKEFNVISDLQSYDIATQVADDFMLMDKSGLWWNARTTASPSWKQLRPVTKKWLDRYHTNWRERTSSDPQWYYQEQGSIRVVPAATASLTNGFTLYYIKVASPMTASGDYPFSGSTTELTFLRPLDDSIISYVRWQLSKPLGKTAKGALTEDEYRRTLNIAIKDIGRRIDIQSHRLLKMRIPTRNRR